MLLYRKPLCSSLVLVLSLSLIGTLVDCRRQGDERGEIRIGVLIDHSDPSDTPTVQAAHLAVAAVNDAGGLDVDGRLHRVVLIVADATTPADAVDSARRLIHQQEVVAVVGPNRSREAIPVANAAENARIPMISPGSTHPQTTAGKAYVFRVAYLDSFQGRVLARFALEELRTSGAAVLYDVANAYNRGVATQFKEALEAAGGEVVAFESYTTGDRDFHRQLVRIRNRQPGVLLLPNTNPDIVTQARQARQLGIDAVLLGSDAGNPGEVTYPPALEGVFFSRHWHPEAADADADGRAFIAAYRQAHGQDPSDSSGLAYDAFGLLFQAIRSADRVDPERIRQALSRIEDYRGVTGTIGYRGSGGDPEKPVVMIRIREGKPVLFKTVQP